MISTAAFRRTIRRHYRAQGRDLPWRHTRDPYKILVSEVMLQQTQVDRVIGYYRRFLERFPTVRALAAAPTRDVLALWSGLGYNRRAIQLQRAAGIIVREHRGRFPRSREAIDALPGVGSYTACAVAAFAYDIPGACIETNIRSVYLHFFYPNRSKISDNQLMRHVERTLDRDNPREWYYALMDYGAMLKKTVPNPSRKSAHHARQSAFKGSRRELRGIVLREKLAHPRASAASLARRTGRGVQLVKGIVSRLKQEGLLV